MSAVVGEGWREARRERILDAASRCFARLSYDGASMDDVAHEAGVGKPTLYRYFRSKDDLFAAVFSDALDALERRLQLSLDRGGAIEAQMGRVVAEIAPVFRDHLVPTSLMGDRSAAAAESKRRIFLDRRARLGAAIAAAIERGAHAGEVREVDPGRVAQLLIGMIWSAAATGASDRDIRRDVVDLLLNGIRAPGPRPSTSCPPGRPSAAPSRPATGASA
jgi:AcrR family transcriptional regulator